MKCIFLINLIVGEAETCEVVLEKSVDLQAPPMVGFLVFPVKDADAVEVVNVMYDMEYGIYRVLLEEQEISTPLIVNLYKESGWK